jgi:hypothetical protein
MSTSSTRLKKPLHIWLARIIGFGIVLGYTWIHIFTIIQYKNTLTTGIIWDLDSSQDENGNTIISDVSSVAAQEGIDVGDQFLNPEADEPGKIGSEVTFQFKRGNLPFQVSLKRQPENDLAYGGVLLGLQTDTSILLALFLAILPIFISVLSALLLCWLRSDDWMALLTAMVIVGLYNLPRQPQWIEYFRESVGLLLFLWLILFPNGKLTPRWSWIPLLFTTTVLTAMFSLFLRLEVIPQPSEKIKVDTFITVIHSISILVILAIMIHRYRHVFSPVERQQSKWIFIIFIAGILPILITNLLVWIFYYSTQFENSVKSYFFNTAAESLFVPVLVLGILFSVFRYRLYDVDVFVSRALVYSGLTGILGVVGVVTVTLIDSIPKQILGDQSGILGIVVSALPIAALFNPVRERLQQIVDRHFKPEEVDFENTFIEFTSELSSFFTLKELSTLLANQAVEQLGVSYASVFLNGQKGILKRFKTTSLDAEASESVLDPKTVETIESGELALPDGDSAYSLVVPLVVPRARKPSVLGALVLGPRLQGLGYSTEMMKSLKNFGEVVGKAFYIAQLKDRKKDIT